MKCSAVQRLLLEMEKPDHPPEAFKAHLMRCTPCRKFHRRLVQLEWQVPLLPVPPSSGKQALVQGVLAGTPLARELQAAPTVLRMAPAGRRDRGLQKAALATALAAGLVLFALFWGAMQWQGPAGSAPPRAAPDPLLAELMKHYLRLAAAKTPRERVVALADIADDLHRETQDLARAASGEDLLAVAKLYDRVVRDGILVQARALPLEERGRVLKPIADNLRDAGLLADSLAREGSVPAAEAFTLIARAARDANEQLLSLPGVEKT